MEVSQFSNNHLQRKKQVQYLVQNAILILISFQWLFAINFLMPYFLLYYYTVLRYGVLYDSTDAKKWEKVPNEKIRAIFRAIGLNKRATNIISRNKAGRLSLKSHININVIKVWFHLVNLPDASIAKQCFFLSNQLATIMENRLSCCLFTKS